MKKFLSLVLALAMTMSLVTVSAGAKDFTDADSIQYVEAVDVMTAIGVVDGDTAGNFNPTAGLTRGAAAKIICNLILGPTTAAALNADANPYVDVNKNSTFAGYIAFCAKEGIISGYADGTFKPAAPLTGYAFMKMLLGALGYDKSVEGYEGANWSINVAKRALNIGLDDGLVDTFNGSDYVTREEAMLYAFNALLSDMVTYDTTITIGDVTIAGSKAEVMENKGKTDGNIYPDKVMQFAEKYFTNLKGYGDDDAFMRPANTWKIKSETVGTYSETPDLSYTSTVKTGTIYADLGLSDPIAASNVSWYVDGAKQSSSWTWDIVKGDTTHKIGGNGVLTEVFYDADYDTVLVIQVNTYVAKIASAYKATTTKDAYVTLNTSSADKFTGIGTTFETDAFAKDDIVAYTYSYKTGENCVESMALADKATGKMTTYTTTGDVTVGGTKYEGNAVSATNIREFVTNVDRGEDVTVYLDENGYVLYIDADTTAQYAVVLGYENNAASLNNDRAKLLFTDGTVKTVEVELATGTNLMSDAATTTGVLNQYDIVSYTIDSDSVYTLTLKADARDSKVGGSFALTNGQNRFEIAESNAMNIGEASSAKHTTYSDGETIYMVADVTNAKKPVYSVYTGFANVPTTTVTGSATTVAVFAKENTHDAVADVIFILKDSDVSMTSDNKDVVFIKGDSSHTGAPYNNGMIYNTELGNYYEYDAFLNGEPTTIKSTVPIAANTLGYGPQYNTKGLLVTFEASQGAINTGSSVVYDATYGTASVKNDVIKLANSYYAVDKECEVYMLNTDGDLQQIDITSVSDDDNDKVWFKTNDKGQVTDLYIQVVDELDSATPASGSLASVAVSNDSTTGDLVVDVTLTANVAALTNTTATVEKYMEATDKWVTVASGVTVGIGAGYNHSGDVIVLADAAVVAGATYRVTITLDGASITSANYTSV